MSFYSIYFNSLHRYFFTFLLLFATQKLIGQSPGNLTHEISNELEKQGLTGAVWSLVNDSTIETGAAGLKNAQLGDLMEVSHQVQIGSVTKTLIATGILRLVSQSKLDLNTPVRRLLKDISFDNPWANSNPITLRHLLDHTSGLQDARLWQVFSLKPIPKTPLEYVFKKDPSVLKIRTKSGSRFSYSNMGYTLLGMVIEAIVKEPYESYLDRELLAPLAMENSTFEFQTQEGNNKNQLMAMGHFEEGVTQATVPVYLRPAVQFTTTANDMALFAKFLMSDGLINQEPFIRKDLIDQMGKPDKTEVVNAGLRVGYSFGLSRRDRYGVIGYFHSGNTVGYRAALYIFPDDRKAFFISINADSETADYGKFNELLIKKLGIPVKTETQSGDNIPSNITNWEGYFSLNPVRFEMFAYLDYMFGFVKVEWDNKTLSVNPPQSSSILLYPMGNYFFRAEDRVEPSHVLYSIDGKELISDGLKTYVKTSGLELLIMWISLLSGMLGLILILVKGMILLVRGRLFSKNLSLTFSFLSIISLVIPIPFFINQSFLELGDLTTASFLLALVTGLLPFTMLFGLWWQFHKVGFLSLKSIDTWAIIALLQWTIVLWFWNMLPLQLWV